MDEPMVEEKTWEEFRESGMLWFANTFLHTFGWAVALDFDDGKVMRAYPARVKYRGFDGDTNDLGYYKVSKFFKENADQLLAECEQPDITKHNPEAVCEYIEGNYNGYDRCELCGCEFTANHSNFCPGCGVKFVEHRRV